LEDNKKNELFEWLRVSHNDEPLLEFEPIFHPPYLLLFETMLLS
jgi:hypothetical protein